MIIASKKLELEIILRDPTQEKVETSTPVTRKKLQDYSWAEISNIAKSGKAQEYFEISDEKSIILKNGEELTIAICGFNHDIDSSSKNELPISFTTKNLLATRCPMNDEDTNKGGWKESKMRKETLKEVFELLPDDLQKLIKSTYKGKTNDKLFLFNEVEIFGKTVYSNDDFGQQYEYYKDKQHRNKYLNDEEYSTWYWLRSPLSSNSTYFCYVTEVVMPITTLLVTQGASPLAFVSNNHPTLCGVKKEAYDYMEMSKDKMIHYISSQTRYGEKLDECLSIYGCANTQEITKEQLQEYIDTHNMRVCR